MSYHRSGNGIRRRQTRGVLAGAIDWAKSIGTVPTAPTAPDPNTLPICPASSGGWCRKYVGGSAVLASSIAAVPTPTATTTTAPKADGGGITGVLASIFGAVAANVGKPSAPQQPVYVPASSGISTPTMIVAGVGLLGIVYLATKN